jgi:hypothetical protein
LDKPNLQATAARINTGTENPDTSRALVVFNSSDQPLSGVAVYEASMTWPINHNVPFVAISEFDGSTVASDMPDMAEGPDPKGRDDHRLLAFQIRFAVQDVPANGWRTYIASFADELFPPDPEGLDVGTVDLTVIETTRHGGDLPHIGTF